MMPYINEMYTCSSWIPALPSTPFNWWITGSPTRSLLTESSLCQVQQVWCVEAHTRQAHFASVTDTLLPTQRRNGGESTLKPLYVYTTKVHQSALERRERDHSLCIFLLLFWCYFRAICTMFSVVSRLRLHPIYSICIFPEISAPYLVFLETLGPVHETKIKFCGFEPHLATQYELGKIGPPTICYKSICSGVTNTSRRILLQQTETDYRPGCIF